MNNKYSPPLCSVSREKLCEWVDNVPWWKRILLCQLLHRKDAKIARALSVAAREYLFEAGGDKIGNDLLRRSDEIWAKIYGYSNIFKK